MALWTYLIVSCLGGAIIYHYLTLWRYRQIASKNGCAPAQQYPHKDPFFGFDLFLQAGKMFSKNTFFPTTIERYKKYGTTFEVRTLGTPTICSIDPANIQAVFASQARNWGVEYRYPALEPYCGRGFLTTNGSDWEHSRTLFSNSFQRANIKDHTTYERHVKLLFDHIPRDGSTMDLQLLVFALVCATTRQANLLLDVLISTVPRYCHSVVIRRIFQLTVQRSFQ